MMSKINGCPVIATCFTMCLLNVQYMTAPPIPRWRNNAEDQICKDTRITVQKVESCPENDTHFQERSTMKNCDSYPQCEGEPLAYHCARYKEYLVEVCTPLKFIRGQCCTMYEDGIGRVIEDYKRECSECPFKYQSHDSIKYAECNVLEKSLFFQHADKELAVTKMIDPETSTLFFFNQTLKHERRTTEKKVALPEINTSDSLKTDKSQTSRSAVEGHFIHAFIHVPVVLSIGTTVVIFAFKKDSYPSKVYDSGGMTNKQH